MNLSEWPADQDPAVRAVAIQIFGKLGIDDPFLFHFQGTATAVDLRRVPATVPVPHVESALTFGYDVNGRFANPFIAGRAQFARSEFLGAAIGAGTSGTIDTGVKPLQFSGDGEIHDLDLYRLGVGLEVGWLQEPRYAGIVSVGTSGRPRPRSPPIGAKLSTNRCPEKRGKK